MVKYVLCLSGGGIRGAAVSSFLQELEKMLHSKFNCSIYNKFDLYAGTSTGSLILGALAYEKFSAEKINNELYNVSNSQQIMDKTKWDELLGTMQTKPKYETDGLKNVIDKFLPGEKMVSDTEKETLITAFDVNAFKPVVFKSFNKKHDIPLKTALRMSSAAPAYFPTVHDPTSGFWCVDGGVFANSPSDCAYAESLKLYGKEEDIRVLSIGTGHNHKKGFGKESEHYGGIEWILKGDLMNLMFSAPQLAVNYKMKTFTEALGHKYLHVDGEIQNASMDDVTPQNIKTLKEQGKLWFKQFEPELEKLLA